MKYLILNKDLREQDCLKELQSNSVQLILTSPPYFNARDYEKHANLPPLIQNAKLSQNLSTQEKTLIHYQNYLKEMRDIFIRLKRLLKQSGYIIIVISDICSNKIHFPLSFHFFNILSEFFIWEDTIIWDKTIELDDRKLHSQRYLYQPFSFYYKPNWSHEYIFIFKKSSDIKQSDYIKDPLFHKQSFITNFSRSIWKIEPIPPDLQDVHPARFPLEIPHHLVKYFSNKGDVVFDCFAGFGTTLLEALRLGRIAVGNDYQKHYCDLIERNIKTFQRDPDFFTDQVKLYRMKMIIRTLKKRGLTKIQIQKHLLKRKFQEDLICKAINYYFYTTSAE
ncbi:MAG: hypothetical protein JXA99_15265 [Candidatus Lokiarchaeota archaeon]|nr:hypothetical protein [Candidatus Lokiarchaeota archaeon]